VRLDGRLAIYIGGRVWVPTAAPCNSAVALPMQAGSTCWHVPALPAWKSEAR